MRTKVFWIGVLLTCWFVGSAFGEDLLVNRRRSGEEVDDFQFQGEGAWAGESSVFPSGFRLYAICEPENLCAAEAVYKFENVSREAKHFALHVAYQVQQGPAVMRVAYNEQAAKEQGAKGKFLKLEPERKEDTLYFGPEDHLMAAGSLEVRFLAANSILDIQYLDLKGYGEKAPVEVVERVVETPVYHYISSPSWPVYYYRDWGPIYRFVGYDVFGRPVYEVSTGYWTSSAFWSWRAAVEVRLASWPVRVYYYDWSGYRPHRHFPPGAHVVRRLPRAGDCPVQRRPEQVSRSPISSSSVRRGKKPNRGETGSGLSLEQIVARNREEKRQDPLHRAIDQAPAKSGTDSRVSNGQTDRQAVASSDKTRRYVITSRRSQSSQEQAKGQSAETLFSQFEGALYRLAGRQRPPSRNITPSRSSDSGSAGSSSSSVWTTRRAATRQVEQQRPATQARQTAQTERRSSVSASRTKVSASTQVQRTPTRSATPKQTVQRAAPRTTPTQSSNEEKEKEKEKRRTSNRLTTSRRR